MLPFDQKDFLRSALSLASGMLGFTCLAAWRSHGHLPTIGITLVLPFGVLTFWGIYSYRMKSLAKQLGFIQNHRQLFEQSSSPSERPQTLVYSPPKLLTQSGQRLIIQAARRRQQFRNQSKVSTVIKDSREISPTKNSLQK